MLLRVTHSLLIYHAIRLAKMMGILRFSWNRAALVTFVALGHCRGFGRVAIALTTKRSLSEKCE